MDNATRAAYLEGYDARVKNQWRNPYYKDNREWMNAWHLQPSEWPQLREPMTAFTTAIREYVNKPDDANDAEVRTCWAALDAALAKEGTEIADQMAWRSQCAHGWWEMVLPAPADLPGRTPRPQIPAYEPGSPFWHAGCNERCR